MAKAKLSQLLLNDSKIEIGMRRSVYLMINSWKDIFHEH